jgi:phosphatidate phosphatase PAH1
MTDGSTVQEALSDATDFVWGITDWTNSIVCYGWDVDGEHTALEVWGHLYAMLP